MSLGSVVLIIFRNVDPLPDRRAGYGRDVIGFGATAVTGAHSLRGADLQAGRATST